jgi:hypothetical protein
MLGINLTIITLENNYVCQYFFEESTFEFGVDNSTTFSYRTFIRTISGGRSQDHCCTDAHSDDRFMFIRTKRTLGH